MKNLTPLFVTLTLLAIPSLSAANVVTKNAAGITITFLDSHNNAATEDILLSAMSLQGIKYKYGGSTPETGFDCSGFVNYVYSKSANVKLPRTTRGISRVGQSISQQSLAAGDLVFFNTAKRPFSHVGIYVGDGKFIHAPRTGGFVRIESMQKTYWKNRYNGAKRLDLTAVN